jgi:hypothetical protein
MSTVVWPGVRVSPTMAGVVTHGRFAEVPDDLISKIAKRAGETVCPIVIYLAGTQRSVNSDAGGFKVRPTAASIRIGPGHMLADEIVLVIRATLREYNQGMVGTETDSPYEVKFILAHEQQPQVLIKLFPYSAEHRFDQFIQRFQLMLDFMKAQNQLFQGYSLVNVPEAQQCYLLCNSYHQPALNYRANKTGLGQALTSRGTGRPTFRHIPHTPW